MVPIVNYGKEKNELSLYYKYILTAALADNIS